ncbi:MAG: alpha-glucan family phosphorylase [Acidobacteriota bacterium]
MTVRPPRIPTLHVADIELPRELEKLYELAYNFWWAWHIDAIDLFSSIDNATWKRYRNPVQLLINVEPRHWYPLLEDETFLARYRKVTDAFETYMEERQHSWFARMHPEFPGLIGYVSTEYGLDGCMPIYSGGLGILSGDHCKSASDLGLPFVAVGLLYRRGYFRQAIDAEGYQQHIYPAMDFARLPIRPVASRTGRAEHVTLPLPGREVLAKLWLAEVGRVPLILLDTDIPENDPADRAITNLLYVRGREMRLVQELVLGLGAARALDLLGIEPAVWHLNEGHSAFTQLERLRHMVQHDDLTPAAAQEELIQSTVFTTHTPVPAGNEQFDPQLVRKYVAPWCDLTGMTIDQLIAAGRSGRDGEDAFNLTALGIRTSSWANGVSKLNAQVTTRMWRHMFDNGRTGIEAITNGVHTLTWIGPELRQLFERHLGHDWQTMLLSPEGWEAVHEIPDAEVWQVHRSQKQRLGRFTRNRLREQYARYGASPDELHAIDGLFDDDALTIGFARRFATYKRASLLFSDPHRLRTLMNDPNRPVQVIFAGKAHPADRPGQDLVRHIFRLSRESLHGKVFFLEDYDMLMARKLVQGVDIWLNTPRRPMEASGTSGQKAALNGVLNFSILDGWWPEGFNGKNGWAIGDHKSYENDDDQDRDDASALYETLESEILPLYYAASNHPPAAWVAMMKEAIMSCAWRFSADRMVRDYTERAYVPTAMRVRSS